MPSQQQQRNIQIQDVLVKENYIPSLEMLGLEVVSSPDLLCNNEWKEGDDSVVNGNAVGRDHQDSNGQKPAKKQARSHSNLRRLLGIWPRNAKVRPEDAKSNPVDVGEVCTSVVGHCTNVTKNSEKTTTNTKRSCGGEYDEDDNWAKIANFDDFESCWTMSSNNNSFDNGEKESDFTLKHIADTSVISRITTSTERCFGSDGAAVESAPNPPKSKPVWM